MKNNTMGKKVFKLIIYFLGVFILTCCGETSFTDDLYSNFTSEIDLSSQEITSDIEESIENSSLYSSEELIKTPIYAQINDNDPFLIPDIKDNNSNYKGEYELSLSCDDILKFILEDNVLHFYHYKNKAIDDGDEYIIKVSGKHMFYLSNNDEMFVIAPDIVVGKPQLGIFKQDLWTKEVEEHYISFGRLEGYSYNYVYAAKDDSYIYFYVRQAVTNFHNVGDGWWQRDNIEIRLTEYMNSEDDTLNTQLYASTLNGGTFSEHVIGKIRMNQKEDEDSLCIVEYEFKIEYFNGLSFEKVIYPLLGANIDAGWKYNDATSGWVGKKGRSPLDPIITHNKGIIVPDLGNERELLSKKVSRTDNTLNTKIIDFKFDTKKNILLKVEGDFEIEEGSNNYDDGYYPVGFAGDIYSYSTDGSFFDYSKGSLTYRDDWCMTNSWSTENGLNGGKGADTKYVYNNDFGNDWFIFRRNMHCVIYVSINVKTGSINIATYLTSNSIHGAKWVEVHSTPITNNGNSFLNYLNNYQQGIGIGFGKINSTNNCKVTYTSVILYSGNQI